MRVKLWVATTATLALAATLVVTVTDLVDVGYRNVQLHVATEVTAALAAIAAAQLVGGRFRSTLRLGDLVLLTALYGFAATNLLFSAGPALVASDPGRFRTWVPVLGSLAATALLALSPFLGERVVHRPARAARQALVASIGGLAVIAAAVLALQAFLPPAETILASRLAGGSPRLESHAFEIAVQLASVVLFTVAAGGFAARAHHKHDVLARWLAVGAILAAFARVNYSLFPSLYTPYFYSGDLLRLGFFVAMFAGAVQETRRLQRVLATAAVVDERHRIARNLHDGVAQDLAYIVQQLRRLGDTPDPPAGIDRLVHAAESALDESRHAVAALARPTDSPLDEAIATTARDAAGREGSAVVTDLAQGVAVTARVQEELLRVIREAVINAARHGGAGTIRVTMRDSPHLQVTISDDGRGFAPEEVGDGRYGVTGMRARVAAIGGELSLTTAPGRGTRIQVDLP
jgi:signal transduction histidine kinase